MSNLSACFPETLGARELVIMVSRQVKRRLDRIIAGQICAALHGLAEVGLKMKPFPGTDKKNKTKPDGLLQHRPEQFARQKEPKATRQFFSSGQGLNLSVEE